MKYKKLLITDIETSGHGSARKNEKKILVLGAFPGDLVDVSVYKKIKNTAYAEIEKIHAYSDLREQTKSFDFPANIPWQNLSLSGEYFLKNTLLKKIYADNKEILQKLQEIQRDEQLPHTHYRNKIAYSFHKNQDQKLCFSLYTRGISPQKKQEQKYNELTHPSIEDLGQIFLEFFNKKALNSKDIKYLILRYSYLHDSLVAHILVPQEEKEHLSLKQEELELFMHKNKKLSGILVSYSPAGVRSARSYKDFYQIGNIDTEERVLGKSYLYHPSLFFQIYPKAFEEILLDVRKNIEKIPKHESYELLDLFAGIGIIGLEMADLVKKVLGVELSSLSKKYAEENSKRNRINNFHFKEAPVDEVLHEIREDQILLIDPTRAGLSKESIQEIKKKKPQYIFYISCNPETQKRDFDLIKEYYETILLKGYNLFPKTQHIESLLVLKKK